MECLLYHFLISSLIRTTLPRITYACHNLWRVANIFDLTRGNSRICHPRLAAPSCVASVLFSVILLLLSWGMCADVRSILSGLPVLRRPYRFALRRIHAALHSVLHPPFQRLFSAATFLTRLPWWSDSSYAFSRLYFIQDTTAFFFVVPVGSFLHAYGVLVG
jgi:hypothetical protein